MGFFKVFWAEEIQNYLQTSFENNENQFLTFSCHSS